MNIQNIFINFDIMNMRKINWLIKDGYINLTQKAKPSNESV